jgi:putative component of toxin-antitoxin plasmid stabilization module
MFLSELRFSFSNWKEREVGRLEFGRLRDKRDRERIAARLVSARKGIRLPVGKGVKEMKIDMGRGIACVSRGRH